MADRFYQIQVRIPAADGLAKDACTNVWHFRSNDVVPGTTPADTANDMIDQLTTFYNGIAALYPLTVTSPFIAKAYDMADPEPRVPVLTRNIVQTVAPAGEPLPDQVAICLSMVNTVASGENPRRSRGRVYIGPIYAGQAGSSASQAVVPAATRTLISEAAHDAFSDGLTIVDPYLCVFSRADVAGGAGLAEAFRTVDLVKIDNRWDIQRRRAEGPTASTQRALSPNART